MKLSEETIEYLLAELTSRSEVLDDLIMYCEDEKQLDEWKTEQRQCEQAIEELTDEQL